MTRRPPSFLPAGRSLAAWLQSGPQTAERRRLALWTYRWRGYWFDKNWQRQQLLYPPADFAGEDGRKLLFVLGFWRSGTTLLHELLAAGPGMAAPRTWQCMNPSGFRIAGPPRSRVAVSRPMDSVAVSALSPQEDEFALLARGAPSAYRAWLDPRRWREALPALEQRTWLTLPRNEWLDDWCTFLGWCAAGDASVLVVKSPNHVFRLQALHRVWPKARMVWTLRDPADTWQSNRKMWRAMSATYGLWAWPDGGLDALLHKAMAEYAAALRWAAAALDPKAALYLSFEQLGCATEQTLRSVVEAFALGPWEAWLPALRPQLHQAAGRAPEAYGAAPPLPAAAAPLLAEVRDLHRRLAHADVAAQ